MPRLRLILFFALTLNCLNLVGQNNIDSLGTNDDDSLIVTETNPNFVIAEEDSTATRKSKFKELDHKKAAWLSTALPGAGQFYVKSYWKIPLVYAGLGTFTALVIANNNQYQRYRTALKAKTDGDPTTLVEPELARLTENSLLANRNNFRRYRDMNVIIGVLFYGLQIADAYVDAHLKGFEINEDLSLHVEPGFLYEGQNFAGGLTFNLRIK